MSSSSTRRLLRATAIAIAVLFVALIAVVVVTALGGGGGGNTQTTPTAQATTVDRLSPEQTAEADDDASLPGEYVDLAAIYGGAYGTRPGTSAHVSYAMDYSPQGLPPAGGPHWGSAACGQDPSSSPPLCGPAPWGIYREPWPAETLVHNMEHAGVIIWYNTADQDVIDDLEAFAQGKVSAGTLLVLAPYPDMDAETVAITIWGRREVMDADSVDFDELQRFIDVLYCRFNPENLPC